MSRRLPTRDAVAGEDDRRLRLLDELECPADDRVLRFWIRRPAYLEGQRVGVLARDVFRELDVSRARLLQTRQAEGLADDLRRRFGHADAGAPLRDRAEHPHDVDVLVRFLVRTLESDLPGDGDERGAVDLCVRHSGDEVGRARPQRGEAHPGIRRETAVDVGHERGALLVPREDELDLVAVRQRGVEGEGLLAWNPEHVPHALVLEAAHEKLRDVHCGDLLIVAESPSARKTVLLAVAR